MTDTPGSETTGATSGTAQSWIVGLSPEAQGRVQNLGWDKLDPGAAAQAAAKAYIEAQLKLSAPQDELVRIPSDPSASDYATHMNAAWKKLGRPDAAEGYDLSAIGDGLDEKMVAAFREAAFKANLPASSALTMADALAKHQAAGRKEAEIAAGEKARVEFEKLQANWGSNWDVNQFLAKKGAQSMGFSEEAVAAMAKAEGGAAVMEGFRKIGAASTEARFIPGQGGQTGNGEMTFEQAMARREELMTDRAWFSRFEAGDAEAKREFNQITQALTRGRLAQRAR